VRQHHKRLLLAPILFWLSLSAGILTKGPITPMIAALTALTLCITTRRWRWLLALRPLLGVITIAAVTLPWLLTLTSRLGHPTSEFRLEMQQLGLTIGQNEGGWATYLRIVYDETLGRSTGAKEGHWGPPGYHLVLLTVLLWPGSLLTGLGIAHAFRRAFPTRSGAPRSSSTSASARGSRLGRFLARLRTPNFHTASRFLLCWIIPSWLVFELVSTKLPHYTMPLYPALALISARAVFAAHRGVLKGLRDLGTRIGFAIWWLVGVAATLGLTIIIIVAGRVDQASSIVTALRPYALPGIVIVIALFAAGRSLARGFYLRAQFQSLAAVVIWGATILQFILPGAQRFWISPRIAESINTQALWNPDVYGEHDVFLNVTGFNEDSLIFLLRGAIQSSDNEQLVERVFMFRVPGPVAVRADSSVVPKLAKPKEGARIRGINYSNGERVNIIILERDRPAP
jgi:4-amino-4-deoxy-L-arabinose transferase-like glycosyltransferase